MWEVAGLSLMSQQPIFDDPRDPKKSLFSGPFRCFVVGRQVDTLVLVLKYFPRNTIPAEYHSLAHPRPPVTGGSLTHSARIWALLRLARSGALGLDFRAPILAHRTGGQRSLPLSNVGNEKQCEVNGDV